jgi:hypothetical protein
VEPRLREAADHEVDTTQDLELVLDRVLQLVGEPGVTRWRAAPPSRSER